MEATACSVDIQSCAHSWHYLHDRKFPVEVDQERETMKAQLKPAAHRQTRYRASPRLDPPEVLALPQPAANIDQAKQDLSEYGLCFLADALTSNELDRLRTALDQQADAERALGELAPVGAMDNQQLLSNMVNKGTLFTDLVERDEVDELAGFLLGKDFLISSITAGVFHGPTDEPQVLHRDQGQVPATADFPALCNMFWLLDDFRPEYGSTWVVPGSHRWPPEYQIDPPPRDLACQITAPAGTLFAFDARIWHGYGANTTGASRRHVSNFLCLPWIRQQENWGVTCLQSTLDNASPKLRRRLGMRTYGTLGGMNGTATKAQRRSLGNYDVEIPEYIIGEGGSLHPVQRTNESNRET
jgi:ectoine hydroxylase-related dioxygenase (phytanoyl-CoA dioxygenase family)